MHYYVLTDIGERHYRCEDGWYVEIKRGACPPVEARRYRTKAEATKAAARLRKKDAYLKVRRVDVVVVAVRASEGVVLFECPTAARAKQFVRRASEDSMEAAIEVSRPAKRKAAKG